MALWTPKNIPTALWLDASDASTLFDADAGGSPTLDGGFVGRIEDKSGNARHATESNSGLRPTRSGSTVVFTANRLQVPTSAFTLGNCIIGVFNSSTTSSNVSVGFLNINSTGNDNPELRIGNRIAPQEGNAFAFYWNGGYAVEGNYSATISSVWAASFVSGITATVWRNGFEQVTATRSGTWGAISEITLGYYNRLSGSRNGTLRELIICDSSNRTIVEGYLAWKWNLKDSLPANHPFKYSAPGSLFKRGFVRQYKSGLPPKPRNYGLIRNRDPDTSSLKHGLVAAYCPSISGQGNVLPDLVGGNHGTLTNMDASDWVSSGDGRALDFDGVNDWVPTTAPGVITTNRSVSIWFRSSVSLANGQYSFLLRWGTATTFPADIGKDIQIGFATDFNFGTNAIGVSQYGDAVGVTGFNDGRWHHGYFEAKGSVYSIYVDGVFRTSKTMTTNAEAGTIRLGANSAGSLHYSGQLDDVRIYNRALSESEIKLLASKRGIGLEPRKPKITFTDLGVKKNYSLIRVKDSDGSTLREGLVGAWCPSLPNGGSGNTLPDQSGRGNHGVLTNMGPEDWVASEGGRAMDFDGVNDQIRAGQTSFPFDSPFAISLWFRQASVDGNRSLFSNYRFDTIGSVSNHGCFVELVNTGTMRFTYRNNGTNIFDIITVATYPLGIWNNLVARYDGAIATLLLNSVVVGTASASSFTSITGRELLLGALDPFTGTAGLARFFNGQLDDVRLYSRPLSLSEIRLLASRRGIGLQNPRDELLFHQSPSGSSRRLLLTGQT